MAEHIELIENSYEEYCETGDADKLFEKLLPVIDNNIRSYCSDHGVKTTSHDGEEILQEVRMKMYEFFRQGKVRKGMDPPQITRMLQIRCYKYVNKAHKDIVYGKSKENEELLNDEDMEALIHGRSKDLWDFTEFVVNSEDSEIVSRQINDLKRVIECVKKSLGLTIDSRQVKKVSELSVLRHYHLSNGNLRTVGSVN